MATITLIIWLVSLGMFLWLSRRLFPRLWQVGDDLAVRQFTMATVMWLIIVFGITSALASDIYKINLAGDSLGGFISWWIPVVMLGKTPVSGMSRMSILFIAGLVALGTCSMVALAYNVLQGSRGHYYPGGSIIHFDRVGSLVIQAVGLLASILGIVSFYLDRIR